MNVRTEEKPRNDGASLASAAWDFQTVTRSVTLSAGRQVMRLVVDDDAGNWEACQLETITVQP